MGRRILATLPAAFLLAGLLTQLSSAQESPDRYDITRIKAAFIYNFIEFVTWPESTLGKKPLVIGILGEDPFGDAFAQVEGRVVFGRTLHIKKSQRLDDLENSSILFVSSSEASRLGSILRQLETKPILTVSDMDDFAENGGMIELYSTDVSGETKVRFEINKDAADRGNLKISFRLLALARPKP